MYCDIIKMQQNANVDMPAYFRDELIHFMSGMRRAIPQDIQNRCV